MKHWYICILLLIFGSCSKQQFLENASLGNQGVVFANSLSPQDSVKFLLHQARYGEGTAYLKLADCYREGFGVKKDFLSAAKMVKMAKMRGAIDKEDNYLDNLPDDDGLKILFPLLLSQKPTVEDITAIMQNKLLGESQEAKTMLGLATIEQGETAKGWNLIKEAAEHGCSFAELLDASFDREFNVSPDTVKLCKIAERVPMAYSILGRIYNEPDEIGFCDKRRAMEYYMKAEEYGVLDSLGARNILEYYKEGGDIHLTDDDIGRLEIICRTTTCSKTVAQEYEASLWDNKAEICPLGDKELIDTCYEVLDRNMVLETDGMYGQVAVVDAASSKVLAWASLENTREEGEEYGDIAYVPFKNNICTRNILATFYDTKLTRQVSDADRSSNAIELAMSFNQMCHQRLPLDFINKNALGKYNTLQYNDGKCTLDEFTFIGCLPANNPKYTVSMVVIRPHKLPIHDGLLTKEVNALVEWLINRNSQRWKWQHYELDKYGHYAENYDIYLSCVVAPRKLQWAEERSWTKG